MLRFFQFVGSGPMHTERRRMVRVLWRWEFCVGYTLEIYFRK